MPAVSDVSRWISPKEGASLLGWGRVDGFLGYLRSVAGPCLDHAGVPTARALDAGVAKAGGKGDWLWDKAFVAALGELSSGPSRMADTPETADDRFSSGLLGLVPWEGSRRGTGLEPAVRETFERFATGRVVRDVCLGRGAGQALQAAMDACAAVLAAVDGRKPFFATGLAEIALAFAALRRLDSGHPLVRFGLVPEPGAFPPHVEMAPGLGGDGLEEACRKAGFPLPADPYGVDNHRHLFAAWEDGVPLVVMHRSGRTRDEALQELFATPEFGGFDAMRARMRRARCDVFPVRADAAFAARVAKLPRRSRST